MIYYFLRVAFIGYLILAGRLLEDVLVIFFKLERSWRSLLLSAFLSFSIVGSLSGAAVVFFKLTFLSIGIILASTLLGLFLLSQWAKGTEFPEEGKNRFKFNISLSVVQVLMIIAYLVLAGGGFYLLGISKTGAGITTPWQTIDKRFIYVFAAATALLGSLLVTKIKSSVVLILFIVHSFLLYSYLPLTHELIYGGDGWRHIATEERLLNGGTVIQPDVTDKSGGAGVPFIIGKLAYSQLWGTSVLIAKTWGLDLFTINKWLMPILWALVLPILLYEIGKSLGLSRKFSLAFVFLSFLPFTWHAGGSFTLPVNYGFIVWLALMLLIFKRAENQQSEQLVVLLSAGILAVFGYSLFTLTFWLSWFTFEFIRFRGDLSFKTTLFLIVGSAVILPFTEWYLGYSQLLPSGSLWEGFKQFLGNFSSIYLAAGPRPHDITTGNVIFNQVPSYSYVANYFTANLWLLVVFMALFWIVVVYGLWVSFSKGVNTLPALSGNAEERNRNHYSWFFILSIGLFLGYIISRYWLEGDHLITRRLDGVLAFLFLALFILGASHIPRRIRPMPLMAAALFLLSGGIAASYSLGPDTNVTSTDELSAVKYIWQEQKNKDKHCVIANTYPLLSLETLSSKKIVGGGFPISSNFEQPELVNFINRKNMDISILDAMKALEITGAGECWLVIPQSAPVSYFIKKQATSTNFGSVDVWRYSR